MTRDELLEILRDLQNKQYDRQDEHLTADFALLEFINDAEITKEYEKIERWYS